ncbi:MAG: N-acetylglucosamine-6-phosphate deacetylase [Fimbriimonas sp.]
MKLIANMLGAHGYGPYEVDVANQQFLPTDQATEYHLIPGFVDIHIHGAFGIDFMSASSEDMITLAGKLEECGYDGFLATTITASAPDVLAAFARLPEHPAILGVHLEGPFISPKFPGAQPPEWIVSPSSEPSEWDAVLDDPRLRLITMAPEIPGGHQLIQRLLARGVIVSMGHTNATFAEATDAFHAGATHTTHTYNAMRPLHHREAGMVGFALSNDKLSTELIYDRHHVCPEAAAILLRSKPDDKVIAVSDSTQATGLAPGQTVEMWGHPCVVGVGEVRLASNGALAGSAITLLDAFRNLTEDFGADVAIRACCLNPRRALMLGKPRSYVLLDSSLSIVDRFYTT